MNDGLGLYANRIEGFPSPHPREPVPKQFLEPSGIYEFEVLATEKGGNQTITEGGVFCTQPKAVEDCEAP